MCPEHDDLKVIICRYRAMGIDELKENINDWEEKNDCATQLLSLDISKKELEIKYKERQEQIELLSRSLTSSSRIGRLISSVKSVIKQLVKIKN